MPALPSKLEQGISIFISYSLFNSKTNNNILKWRGRSNLLGQNKSKVNHLLYKGQIDMVHLTMYRAESHWICKMDYTNV